MGVVVDLHTVFSDGEFLVVVDGNLDGLLADGFVGVVVELRKVRMLEALLHVEPVVGVHQQQFVHQVQGVLGSSGEQLSEVRLLFRRKTAYDLGHVR